MSLLPQQIPPQTEPWGTVDKVTGKVTIDVNWWLFLLNISKQVLSAPSSPVPVPPATSIALLQAQDVGTGDEIQAYRGIANAVALEAQDIELARPDVAGLPTRINNAQLLDIDPDIAPTLRDMVNALILATDPLPIPTGNIGNFNSPLPLAQGGTGDGKTFSWTGGASKTLIANTVTSDGIALTLNTPNPAAGVSSGQVLLESGSVTGAAGSGNVIVSAGTATTGAGGDIRATAGNVTGGGAGEVLLTGGSATSGTAGLANVLGGNCSTGTSGGANLQGGNASSSGAGGSVNILGGTSSTGTCGDVQISGGTSTSGPGGTTKIGSITLLAGFSGTTSGKIFLNNSFNNAVVQVTDDGTNNVGELGFYGATPINRPTTAFAAATFVQGAGNAVNDASTFDGYTLKQIVKTLRSLGLLT